MKSKPISKPAWLHPASYFLLWAGVLLWVQALALSWLLLMSAGWLLLACWCSWPAMRIGLRRLLPLVVVAYVAFGWTVPGDAAWPSQYAPSWQGLLVASRHSGQLLLMSAVARCVLWYLSRDEVLLGLRTLLWPLRGCRIEVDRLALQVALTLYQVDEFLSRQPLRWQEVQEALRNWQQPLPHLPAITLQSRRFALRDGLVFLVYGLVVLGGYQIG